MEGKPSQIIHINTVRLDDIDIMDKFDIAEYKKGDSMLVVTHRLDGISEKHLTNALHTHNYYEFELVYGGRGVQILHRSSFEMHRGCAYLRTPNNLHTTHQNPYDRLKSYNIRFSADFIPINIATGLMAEDNAISVEFEESELQRLTGKIEALTYEIRNTDPYSQTMITSLFCEILVDFVRKYNLTAKKNLGRSLHVTEIIDYINKNYRGKLSVAELSRIFGLNPHYMGSLFINEVGRSIPRYILDLRLILSTQLLASSSMSVSEIAYECGFSSPSYFIEKFRERYGAPPKKYISGESCKDKVI